MSKAKKLLATATVVGLVGSIAGWATFSAFSSTTQSAGNRFVAGTVEVGANSLGSFMYQVDAAKPGTTVTKCTKVTYTGSLDADVKLYASTVGAVGEYVDLTVTAGTGSPTFPGCTGFTAVGSDLYSGTLKGFADTYGDYDSGLSTTPDGATKWVANDAVAYRFTLTLQDDNSANGGATAMSTGDHAFTWQARNR